jgi:ABC-type amino acid transport system permease subunit
VLVGVVVGVGVGVAVSLIGGKGPWSTSEIILLYTGAIENVPLINQIFFV